VAATRGVRRRRRAICGDQEGSHDCAVTRERAGQRLRLHSRRVRRAGPRLASVTHNHLARM
jgi:hypothetical protein